jgi:hypothetical protein
VVASIKEKSRRELAELLLSLHGPTSDLRATAQQVGVFPDELPTPPGTVVTYMQVRAYANGNGISGGWPPNSDLSTEIYFTSTGTKGDLVRYYDDVLAGAGYVGGSSDSGKYAELHYEPGVDHIPGVDRIHLRIVANPDDPTFISSVHIEVRKQFPGPEGFLTYYDFVSAFSVAQKEERPLAVHISPSSSPRCEVNFSLEMRTPGDPIIASESEASPPGFDCPTIEAITG